MAGIKDSPLLATLGKYKSSGGCLYINTLADVDVKVLAKLIEAAYIFMKKTNS